MHDCGRWPEPNRTYSANTSAHWGGVPLNQLFFLFLPLANFPQESAKTEDFGMVLSSSEESLLLPNMSVSSWSFLDLAILWFCLVLTPMRSLTEVYKELTTSVSTQISDTLSPDKEATLCTGGFFKPTSVFCKMNNLRRSNFQRLQCIVLIAVVPLLGCIVLLLS